MDLDWTIDNIIYFIVTGIGVAGGAIAKIIHAKQKKPLKTCPNLKIIENDLNNLKESVENFEAEIKEVIENEVEHAHEVHKMLFDKVSEVSSKIDYMRGQVDQHLKDN
ncbi:hypothetical protein [Nitrosopumilus sp.]|uniref:hypothetical protein n=1 Tax=Nitrosopumilus sp. TaxID=2024843 RepID=UPI003D14B29A